MVTIWLVAFVILLILEGITQALVTIWFAIGALIALVFTFLGVEFWIQIIIFLVSSGLMLYFVFPIARKKLNVGKARTNVNDLIGKEVVVTKEIRFNTFGEVSINGVIWSANSKDEIKEGSRVRIISIEGNKVVVEKNNNK